LLVPPARFRRALSAHLRWIVPALVAATCLPATVCALWALTFAPLGRDQGIFQYVAWALRNGARGYSDFHEINGPLPHAWHLLLQKLGGEDAHVFRSIDTLFIVSVYAVASASIPQWLGRKPSWPEAAAWSLAGLALLGAQYARYDWWQTSQREALYAVLLYGSLALQILGHGARTQKRAFGYLAAAGALTALTWYGKPPCALFAGLQLAVLVADRRALSVSLGRAIGFGAIGAAVSSAAVLLFVLAYEDWRSGLKMLSVVPLLHHTIWHKSIVGCYQSYGNGPRVDWAAATTALLLAAFFIFRLPRQALLAFVLPLGGFAVFVGQGKGFPYHMHMMTLGTAVAELLLMAVAAEWAHRAFEWCDLVALAALGLGMEARQSALLSPGVKGDWSAVGATPQLRSSTSYLEDFPWGDFFLKDLHDASDYVRQHTRPDDRLQTFGLDPYFLFLSRRQSATPVIYNFELNVDATLEGGEGGSLSPAERARVLAYREDAESQVLEHVITAPPAAFIFFDHAPFTYPQDGEADFARHCPRVYRWLDSRYGAALRFGTIRVRFRSDR
jgi:hypothetical protein